MLVISGATETEWELFHSCVMSSRLDLFIVISVVTHVL